MPCPVKFNESLNSAHVLYSQWFVKWWHLPKKSAKIVVDEGCPRCDGVVGAEVNRNWVKVESWHKFIFGNYKETINLWKQKDRTFPFTGLLGLMCTHICVFVIKRRIDVAMSMKEKGG